MVSKGSVALLALDVSSTDSTGDYVSCSSYAQAVANGVHRVIVTANSPHRGYGAASEDLNTRMFL